MTTKIQMKPGKSIHTVQYEFNRLYPYLKIEFFKEPDKSGKGSAKSKMIQHDAQLGEIQKIQNKAPLFIDGTQSVSTFEKAFEENYGLYVQVFRKSGNVWLETTATDNWSLNQQNEEGKLLAQHFKIERENPEDHDVY